MKRLLIICLVVLTILLAYRFKSSPQFSLDQDEVITESFADFLSDWAWAIRDGNEFDILAGLSAELDSNLWPTKSQVQWSGSHPVAWIGLEKTDNSSVLKSITAEQWTAELEKFLRQFSELEDVQIKVVDSQIQSESKLSADWKLSFWGRDNNGQRIWLALTGSSVALKVAQEWKIVNFQVHSCQSMKSSVEMFTEVSTDSGLRTPYKGTGRVETSGSPGACTGDLDGDGYLDIISSDFSGVSVYLNQGDGTFLNRGSDLLPSNEGNRFQQSPLLVDMDNDGDLDLFLSGKKFDNRAEKWVNCGSLQKNLLKERGVLEFENVTERLGPSASLLGGYSVSSCDLNNDSIPDFFVSNWKDYAGQPLFYLASGASEFANSKNGGKNLLFISQPDGSYNEEAESWGVAGKDWSFVGSFADLDQDGDQDLVVANDYGPNRLYINQGSKFEEQAQQRGASRGGFGMGISFGDFDNNGTLDLHSTNMSSVQADRIANKLNRGVPVTEELAANWSDRLGVNQGNRLLRNRGDGHFEDCTGSHGPFYGGWGYGGGFIDIDNDGFLDLFAPNGRVSGNKAHDT